MNDNTIYIDIEDGRYVLDGDGGVMLENRRLLFPLRRLKFMEEGGKVYIPFQEPTKISVLQEIQDSLAKFNLQLIPRQQVKDNLSTYHNEQQSFAQLADRARKIRNNEIVGDQQLVDGFDHFQTILNRRYAQNLISVTTIVRLPYGIRATCLQFRCAWSWQNLHSLWCLHIFKKSTQG